MRLEISILMRWALFLLLAGVIEAQQSATTLTSTIEGTVIEGATGRPIRDVRVWTDISPAGEFTSTDQNGHFRLTGVPIGLRSIRVRKPGYALARTVGLKPPGLAPAAAQIYLDARKPFLGLVVQLVPEGSISGRVLPEGFAGNLLRVSLARSTFGEDGARTLVAVETVPITREIDKWGEYRFEGLEPGEYYVYINPGFPSPAKAESVPLTYYPNAFDLASASRIIVNPGQDVRLRDLQITSSVRAPSVRFRFVNATSDAGAVNGCPSVALKLRGVQGDEERKEVTVCPPALSSISLGSLAPGVYDAYAGWNIGMSEGASVSFEVRDLDLDVEVVVSRARITGKIMFELPDGTVKPAENVQLVLTPKGAGRRIEMKTASDGTIGRDRVGPAQYTVAFPQLPTDAYIAQLTEGRRNVLAEDLDVRSTDLQLTGIVSLRGATLEGTILDSNHKKVSGAIAVLVPDPPFRSSGYRYSITTTDRDGEFIIRGIAPGSYHLFAWSELDGMAYKNADFMRKYETRAKSVVLQQGQRAHIEGELLD